MELNEEGEISGPSVCLSTVKGRANTMYSSRGGSRIPLSFSGHTVELSLESFDILLQVFLIPTLSLLVAPLN